MPEEPAHLILGIKVVSTDGDAAEDRFFPQRHPMTEPDRAALRAELRARRRALTATDRMRSGARVGEQLAEFLPPSGWLAGYWACDGELPLHALPPLPAAARYCLPVLQPECRLRFAGWLPGRPLRANRYGIPEPEVDQSALLEPESLDLVLLPLLGFSRSGARLGSGGGYYDRSFAFLNASPRPAAPRLIGVGYACQEIEHLRAEPWDVALDLIITEREVIVPAAS